MQILPQRKPCHHVSSGTQEETDQIGNTEGQKRRGCRRCCLGDQVIAYIAYDDDEKGIQYVRLILSTPFPYGCEDNIHLDIRHPMRYIPVFHKTGALGPVPTEPAVSHDGRAAILPLPVPGASRTRRSPYCRPRQDFRTARRPSIYTSGWSDVKSRQQPAACPFSYNTSCHAVWSVSSNS